MSTEQVTCAMCGSPMPANSRFCPECGHANRQVDSAADLAPGQAQDQSGMGAAAFATPMEPPRFADDTRPPAQESAPDSQDTVAISNVAADESVRYAPSRESAAGTSQGSPTVRIGEAPAQPMYASPDPSNWQPGQYATPAASFAQAPPPPYSPEPLQAGSLQQYTPPPQPLAQSYSGYPQPDARGVVMPMRDPTIALLLELIGYFGFLGIGHMYGGRIGRGIALLAVWWVYWGIALFFLLTVIGAPLACVMAVIWPFVPIGSGLWIRSDLAKEVSRQRGY